MTMEDVDEIMDAVVRLTDQQRQDLVRRMRQKFMPQSLCLTRQDMADERWAHLRSALNAMTGEDISNRCRKHRTVMARWCALEQMSKDGYTTSEIARASGYNHATVIYTLRQVCNAKEYPEMYLDFVELSCRLPHWLNI